MTTGAWVGVVAGLVMGCSGSGGVSDTLSETPDDVSDIPDPEVADPSDGPADVAPVPEDVEADDTALGNDPEDGPDTDTPVTDDVSETPSDTGVPTVQTCQSGSASGSLDIPEASGAARFSDGVSIIVADSGNRGLALLLTADGTPTRITLPLDGPTHATLGHFTDDDLEGLDIGADGRLYGLTSAGWLRAWTRAGQEFTLVGASAPISDDPAFACADRTVNCGPNYEGLCLRPADVPAPSGRAAPCVGYAASKTRGELVCLVPATEGAPFQVDSERVFATGFEPEHVSDCAFFTGSDGRPRVLVAGNLLSGSLARVFVEDTLVHETTDVVGAINQEALLAREPGLWWSLGDLQQYSDKSPWTDIHCPVAANPNPTTPR